MELLVPRLFEVIKMTRGFGDVSTLQTRFLMHKTVIARRISWKNISIV